LAEKSKVKGHRLRKTNLESTCSRQQAAHGDKFKRLTGGSRHNYIWENGGREKSLGMRERNWTERRFEK